MNPTATHPATTPVRVMLVDDHAIVRAGYRRLLDLEPGFAVVAECGDGDAAFAQLQRMADARPPAVDLVVLDLSMPGRSGLDLLRRIGLRWPVLRVLVFSMHDSPAMVAQALKAGAHGFVTKSSEPDELVAALRRVAAGEVGVCSADIAGSAETPAAQPPHMALSVREFDVLRGLVEGLGIEQIAERLHLSPKTVSNHQTQIRQRLGVATAVELLRYAQQHRLFVP
ncbi:response regulator transcription factor [Ideonella sp. DXS22W]|uniref:Response regulator transcription factor n=1 Tax=Pseudaquabacterium inlustre TaxID=2984192 RepID=A0ABU9CBV3_9BURK